MNSNGFTINGRTAVSLGLVLALLSALIASAVAWGRMQQQVCTKLDQAQAERDFVRKADLSRQLDSIDRRLTRIEEKLDRALQARELATKAATARAPSPAGLPPVLPTALHAPASLTTPSHGGDPPVCQ